MAFLLTILSCYIRCSICFINKMQLVSNYSKNDSYGTKNKRKTKERKQSTSAHVEKTEHSLLPYPIEIFVKLRYNYNNSPLGVN